MTDWQNRIVAYTTKRADELTGNPRNPRRHPQRQRNAVKGSLDTLGWIAPVVENVRTGYLIDGHERVMQALGIGDDTPVPVIQVDLAEHEEAQALATFDFITYMAEYDRENLDALLRETNSDDANVQALLAEIGGMATQIPINPYDEWVGMPDFEQETIKPYRELIVRFESEEAVQEFMGLIGQTFTDKTKYIYHPKQQKLELKQYRVVDEP